MMRAGGHRPESVRRRHAPVCRYGRRFGNQPAQIDLRRDAELAVDGGQMRADGGGRDEEPCADLPVARTVGIGEGDLTLPPAQVVVSTCGRVHVPAPAKSQPPPQITALAGGRIQRTADGTGAVGERHSAGPEREPVDTEALPFRPRSRLVAPHRRQGGPQPGDRP
jgi:hypothetical protein